MQNRFGVFELMPYKTKQNDSVTTERNLYDKQINAGIPDARNRRINTTIKNDGYEGHNVSLLFRGLYKCDELLKQLFLSNSVYFVESIAGTDNGENIFVWANRGTFTDGVETGINYSPNLSSHTIVSPGHGGGGSATRCTQGTAPLTPGIYPTGDNYFIYSNGISLKPNKLYVLEAWIRVDEPFATDNDQQAYVQAVGLSGASIQTLVDVLTVPTVGVWQKVTTTIQTGAAFEFVNIVIAETDADGFTEPCIVSVDDISVYENNADTISLIPIQIQDSDTLIREFNKPFNQEIVLKVRKDNRNTAWGTSNF
jgi:hypothetical protein